MAIKISGTTVIDDSQNLFVAAGGTAARPTPVTGAFRFNTDDGSFEGYDGSAWGSIGGGVPLNANNDYYLDADLVVDGEVISLSDENFKENIIDIDTTSALEVVKGLRPVYYNMIGSEENDRRVGFIAQEVEKLLPEVVYDADGVLHLSYGNMIAVLTSALQDALNRIEELENVISSK